MRNVDPSEHLRLAFDANAADILAYAERRVTVRADAADIVSETMVTAWRRVNRLPAEPQQARMWLFVIARNTVLNHNRGRHRADAAFARFRDEFAAHIPADSVETTAEAIDVRRAVAALPDPLAELVRLVHWDEFSLADAATMLGIPPATARGRYLKARSLLHDALASGALLGRG